MSEPFNFTKNLTEIIGTEFKRFGFKKKGNEFTRVRNEYIEKILFLRSRLNSPAAPFQFYIYLYLCDLDEKVLAEIVLTRNTSIVLPDYVKEKKNDQRDSNQYISTLTKEEETEYGKWFLSKLWKYSSEKELINLFLEVKDMIPKRGFEFFDKVKEIVKHKGYEGYEQFISKFNGWD